jgi:hypothetical protein
MASWLGFVLRLIKLIPAVEPQRREGRDIRVGGEKGAGTLGKTDGEDSIPEHGADLGGTGIRRDFEVVRKAAAGMFDGVVLLAVQAESAVAGDGQRATFHGDLHVFLLHLRQVNLEYVPAGVFADGDQRDPLWRPRSFLRPVHAAAAKEASQAVPQVFQLVQLIPPQPIPPC